MKSRFEEIQFYQYFHGFIKKQEEFGSWLINPVVKTNSHVIKGGDQKKTDILRLCEKKFWNDRFEMMLCELLKNYTYITSLWITKQTYLRLMSLKNSDALEFSMSLGGCDPWILLGVNKQQCIWQTQPVTCDFSLISTFSCEPVELTVKLVTLQQLWIQILVLLLSNIMKLGKLLHLSEPQNEMGIKISRSFTPLLGIQCPLFYFIVFLTF